MEQGFFSVNEAAPDTTPARGGIVLIISGGPLAWCVANYLSQRFAQITIIQERAETKFEILKRRSRLLGWSAAFGQAACAVALRLTSYRAESRRKLISQNIGVSPLPNPDAVIRTVPSVNSDECRELLRALNPAVIAVYGTRIINSQTLKCSLAPFINYHAGITPMYRGQHPAYWALANGDAGNAGVTIHLVDTGVDTGDILYQARVTFDAEDTIQSYQWAQLPVALPLFVRAIEDAFGGQLAPYRGSGPSRHFFPPTLTSYFSNAVLKGVW